MNTEREYYEQFGSMSFGSAGANPAPSDGDDKPSLSDGDDRPSLSDGDDKPSVDEGLAT